MGIRTLFNLLGPLTNPAGASCQLLGVYDPNLTEPLAWTLHGLEGLDEISLCGQTRISRLLGDTVTTTYLRPEDLGFSPCGLDEIKGGDAAENARHLVDVLEGKPGPRRDVALMNAAAALVVANAAGDFAEGLVTAAKSVDSGSARHKLAQFLQFEGKE